MAISLQKRVRYNIYRNEVKTQLQPEDGGIGFPRSGLTVYKTATCHKPEYRRRRCTVKSLLLSRL